MQLRPGDRCTSMTLNNDVVLRYMNGCRQTDREQFLSCLTDDGAWKIPGILEIKRRLPASRFN